MGLLEKKRIQDNNDNNSKIPSFDKTGHVRRKWLIVPKTIGFIIILFGFLIGAIHMPVLFAKDEIIEAPNKRVLTPNEAGIRNAIQYIQDHPNDDLDNDGLTNAEETSQGTDPRDPDSDRDGVSDYAEIYLYNTRPTERDNNIEEIFRKALAEKGVTYSTPYKIHNIIMWADNLKSRARGIVVPSLRGYRFINFDGWVQLPGNVYAYKVENNIHIPLEYRAQENVWRIDSYGTSEEIALYNDELKVTHMLTLFGKNYSIEDNQIATFLSCILPKKNSFITLRDVVLQDIIGTEISATVTGTTMPEWDKNNMERFGKNTNEMTDIVAVYSSILSGKPVVVSLQSAKYGETICLAYGYTEYGDILLADENGNKTDSSGNPMILDIIEMAAITVDQTGEIRQREYFDFKGIGYDSTSGDRIHFLQY